MFSPYIKTGEEKVVRGAPSYSGREAGNQEAMAAAEVSRLGLALHFARRTYSNRFARIRTTKSLREKRTLGFTLVMRAPEERRRNGGITPSRKVGIMAAVQCGCTAAALSRKSSKTSR